MGHVPDPNLKAGAQGDEPEIDWPKLGRNVEQIAKALKSLEAGGLNRHAIIALIHDDTRIAKRDIKTILDSLASMRDTFFHKPKKGVRRGRR